MPDNGSERVPVATASATIPELAGAYDATKRHDIATVDPALKSRALQLAGSVQRLDGATVNGYGIAVQQKANVFLDDLLGGLRTAQAGPSGALVAQMATGVRMLDIPGLRREAQGLGGALAGLPLVGKYVSAFARFRANHAKLVDHFQAMEAKGRQEMATLAANDSRLDAMVEQNLQSMRELEVHVLAGQEILDRERSRFSRAREVAVASGDPARIAAVRDHGETINAFEVRLLRLNMALTDSMMSVPQTRMTQSAGRIEYRNISDTLLFDLPKLKQAVIRLASLKAITDASKASDARRRLAEQMQAAGVEALEKAYVGAKESEGGALAEIERMGEIADRIVGILEKGAEIDAANRASREQAAVKLAGLKDRYMLGMTRATANAVGSARD